MYSGPDAFHHARRLVAQQEWEVVVDGPFPVVQVGVAHPAGLHLNQGLAGAEKLLGLGERERLRAGERGIFGKLAGEPGVEVAIGDGDARETARVTRLPFVEPRGG